MKVKQHVWKKVGVLLIGFLLYFGMTVAAAPSVEGDTTVTVQKDQVVTANYTITNDKNMEEVKITISYDKKVLTYMSGSGGNNFSGNGGNGTIQLSSKPGDTTATFTIKFKGKADTNSTLQVTECYITVDGAQIDVLNQGSQSQEFTSEEGEEDDETENEQRASFVIDERTFYVRRPDDVDNFEKVHMDIQGIDCRVLKHNTLDIYLVKLISDNGSYRDNFVYNPDTGNVIPYVNMNSGIDEVIFIEPDENVYIPTRYSYVDLGWGPKYTIPAYKHVVIDGVDEIPDDTNIYLIYGINQDGEKAWYSYNYDKNSLQLFDDVAYQGEQSYITELEEKDKGLRSELAYQLNRYNTNMGHRLTIIMIMTVVIVILLNVIVLMYFRMRKMVLSEDEDEEEEDNLIKKPGKYAVGGFEENEADFQELEEEPDDDLELEIIDLDNLEEEEEE